jgi:hypothetical protein
MAVCKSQLRALNNDFPTTIDIRYVTVVMDVWFWKFKLDLVKWSNTWRGYSLLVVMWLSAQQFVTLKGISKLTFCLLQLYVTKCRNSIDLKRSLTTYVFLAAARYSEEVTIMCPRFIWLHILQDKSWWRNLKICTFFCKLHVEWALFV